MDAAIGPHCSSIAFVARDWRWELVFACSKRMNTILPLQAEAEAIKWALTLAANLEFEAIIIELDSQVCSNLLSNLEAAPLWRIKSICEDSQILWHLLLRSLFVGCPGCAIWLPTLQQTGL